MTYVQKDGIIKPYFGGKMYVFLRQLRPAVRTLWSLEGLQFDRALVRQVSSSTNPGLAMNCKPAQFKVKMAAPLERKMSQTNPNYLISGCIRF